MDTVAVKTDGTVKCWGANWNGQLGDGWPAYRSTPVSVIGIP
jgi:alpha-tubulin suppressor-like RCC1 family protein